MRRTGVRGSLQWNFVIHQIFPEFLQPFRNLRIITQVSPFNRGLFFIGVRCLVGLGFLRFPPLTWTDISPAVGEEREDEEDEEERLSCFIGVREVDEDPEDELDKPGTTIGTKFGGFEQVRFYPLWHFGFFWAPPVFPWFLGVFTPCDILVFFGPPGHWPSTMSRTMVHLFFLGQNNIVRVIWWKRRRPKAGDVFTKRRLMPV